MTPAALVDLVRSSAEDVLISRGLDPAVLPAAITVTRPRNPRHGDYATTVALQVAGKARVAPREFAGWLVPPLVASSAVRCAEVAGPGFVNLRLAAVARNEIIRQVLALGERFGAGDDRASGSMQPAMWAEAANVQYAHARLTALLRNAAALGIPGQDAELGLLEHEREVELINILGEFPAVVAARLRRPSRMTRYLERLADTHHIFSDVCRMLPMGDEEPGPRHVARLALCQATRQVLANGLGLLSTSAPERM
ncbi:MAG: DALR anticodon-binding domain-containing protein [Pseudonocardiaceae bacterium]